MPHIQVAGTELIKSLGIIVMHCKEVITNNSGIGVILKVLNFKLVKPAETLNTPLNMRSRRYEGEGKKVQT